VLKQRHQIFVLLFACLDAMVIAAACFFAWLARHAIAAEPIPSLSTAWVRESMVLIAVPVGLAVLWVGGLYRPRRDRPLLSESWQVVRVSCVAVLTLVAVLWVSGEELLGVNRDVEPVLVLGHSLDPARIQFAALALLLPLTQVAHRMVLRLTLRALRRRGRNLRHVAIIGVGRLGQIAARTLSRNSWTGLHVAFHIDHNKHATRPKCAGREVAGGLADLERIIEDRRVDAVYLALPAQDAALVPEILRRLERFCLDVRIIPDVPLRYLPQSMTVSELEGMPILSCRESPLNGLGGMTKRGVDLLVGVLATVGFLPVMLVVALLVRLSGPGPIVFRQRRVGLGGEQFWIYKFRTMTHVEDEISPLDEADDARAAWTQRNDPRITPIGRILRRVSLDELPQLFNVLRGEMSLVGPRPERPELIDRFKEDWRGYMLRQHVKAGMTGWAQVNGLRGNSDLRKRLQHDLYYVRHWSLGFDLKILWLTLFRGFINRNAH